MYIHAIISSVGFIILLIATSVKCLELHEILTDEEFFNVFRTTRDNVPEYEVAPIMHNLYKQSATNFRIKVSAFGEKIETFLHPTDGVLAGENTPVWRAFTKKDGTVNYVKMRNGIVGAVAKSFESETDLASIIVTQDANRNKLNFQGSLDDDKLRVAPVPGRVREITKEEFERLKREVPRTSRTLIATDLASIILRQDENKNKLNFRRILDDDNLQVGSVPGRVQEVTKEEFERLKRETQKTSRTLIASDYHVIIKTRSLPNDNSNSLKRKIREVSRLFNETNEARSKRSRNDVIYPSLLITTDFKDTKTTHDDLAFYEDIVYQLAFWNAVDLRFRHLESPKVRLHIAGLIIGQDRSATPWIKNHMEGEEINVRAAWDEMQKYWYKQRNHPDFSLDGYNTVVTMTDSKMFTVEKDGSKVNTLGLASVGGLCQSTAGQIMPSNLIAVDHRGFDGVRTATHELGHVLGAYHDDSNRGNCAKSLGFIMAPTAKITDNSLKWSSCSKRQISIFLRQSKVNCADEPSSFHPQGNRIDGILPGILLDDHRQCQSQGYHWACDATPNICKHLRCSYSGFDKLFNGCYEGEPAADGTKCSSNAACIDGECRRYYENPS